MIQCVKCGSEIADNSKFCSECGAPQVKECPICRAKMALTAKFCSECGALYKQPVIVPAVPRFTIPAPVENNNTIVDLRDGQIYRTVKIGSQTWLSENFAFFSSNSYVYANRLTHAKEYGRLYTWNRAKLIAPPGWHLPTREDFAELVECCKQLGTDPIGVMLKSNTDEWKEHGIFGDGVPGKDIVGFDARPMGSRTSSGVYNYLGNFAYFWCADEADNNRAYYRHLSYFSGDFKELATSKDCAFSVRLVKNK